MDQNTKKTPPDLSSILTGQKMAQITLLTMYKNGVLVNISLWILSVARTNMSKAVIRVLILMSLVGP